MENVPFEVMEGYDVQDLTDVKADKQLLPVTKGLKVRIDKAGTQANKNKNIYSLKLECRIVDGIEQVDKETGETKMAYVNKPIFTGIMDLVFGAKLDVEDRANKKWWKGNQHLVEFKNFCKALDIDLKGIKVDDDFVQSLVGREVLVDVTHEAETMTDEEGKKVKTGEFREKLRNWRKAS